MKFGKNLALVIGISDPEWAPFWINYKYLKKKINDIVTEQTREKAINGVGKKSIEKSESERDFFTALYAELRKASEFFTSSEQICKIRQQRVQDGYRILKESQVANKVLDKCSWKMLLSSCTKLYRDVLLLENFAIMNYCGFSKILKKHDKLTGYTTREAFMKKVMSKQNFTHYPVVLENIKRAERMFSDIQQMESSFGLHDEEKLFIEALRGLNYQAFKLQEEEKDDRVNKSSSNAEYRISISKDSTLFPLSGVECDGEKSQELGFQAMETLDQATSVAMNAAVRISSLAPNIQQALSWMDGIRRKEVPSNSEVRPEDTVSGHKRKAPFDSNDDQKIVNGTFGMENLVEIVTG